MIFDKSLFDNLKNIKDNVLAIFLVNYAIGYIAFSVYSYKNSLGVVSAFDLQYFLAGIIPSLSLLIIYIIINGVKYFNAIHLKIYSETRLENIYKYITTEKNRRKASLSTTAIVGTLIMLFNINSEVFKWVIMALSIALTLLFTEPDNEEIEKRKPFLAYLLIVFFKLMFLLIFIGIVDFYYSVCYERIPQELGGVRTKKAVLYSDSDIFNTPRKTPALYSDTVLVYYYNSSSFIYKKSPAEIKSTEVNRTKISKVVWLD
jgi:hypothetical protein